MNKFILVHDASNGNPIVINKTNILTVTKSETFTGCSTVHLNDLDMDCPHYHFHVAESPEKIYEMLNN